MDTFAEMIAAVQSDLTIGAETSFMDEDTVKLAVKRAYRKIAALFRWPALEDAKTTTTSASLEYYEYPTNWRDDSIWRLEVDNLQWGELPDGSPLNFPDYLTWRRDVDNATSTEKKWSNQRRRYFIYPVPTTNVAVISIWGQKSAPTLSANSDETIFSVSMPDVNEAIVMEAKEILKGKGDVKNSDLTMISPAALQQATIAWTKITQEQAKYEKNLPGWEVPDMFPRNRRSRSRGSSRLGNF